MDSGRDMSEIAQALFGYGNGHQLLASSISLPSRSARQLRALTDMAFDGHAERYLTALPLPDLGRYGLIRSWPAHDAPRRGSVWSHCLLVDFVVLASLDELATLTALFRQPRSGKPAELAAYERDLPLSKPTLRDAVNVSYSDLDRLLWTIYGSDENAVLRTDNTAAAEELLFAIWQQQWPRLRRAFAFRTRYRVSDRSAPFDLQVVERLDRDQEQVRAPEVFPTWLAELQADMRDPQRRLSVFLRRFGAESRRGRRDMPALVDVAQMTWTGAGRPAVVTLVGKAFTEAQEMPALKRALLGLTTADDDGGVWTAPEVERLRLLLHAEPATAFDLDDLRLGQRLDALWNSEREDARTLLECIDFSQGENSAVRAAVLSAAIRHAQPADLSAVSEANPEVAITVVKERSDLLAEPALWRGEPPLIEFLLDLLADADSQTRQKILLRQLDAGVLDGAARLVESEPDLWWQALRWSAESSRPADELSRTLAPLLEAVGAGSIGVMPDLERTPRLLEVLAISVSPSLGLWRQVDGEEWQRVAMRWQDVPERWAQLRMLVVLLAAAKSARREAVRRMLWLDAFPPLHNALVRDELSRSDLQTLISLLPTPSGVEEWDHAGRLRAALVNEIRRGAWPRADVEDIVRATRPYEQGLLEAIAARKKKNWLRELADQILP